jgi:hypothetical protein
MRTADRDGVSVNQQNLNNGCDRLKKGTKGTLIHVFDTNKRSQSVELCQLFTASDSRMTHTF